MALKTGAKLGPYEVLTPLGAGGMGEVYRARDTRLDRAVAVKTLPSHMSDNPELKQRFEREARAISSLTHPHICTLYDIGQHDGVDYIVMEYIEGETLAQKLSKGALPIDQVLRIGSEIASALDKAHRSDVVHRDLKPGNIMLTKTGAKLLDFGLAKSANLGESTGLTITKPLTGQGTLLGTFQYMAPEQLEGKEADTRTDIFAFGAVLYEMATGRRPFEGKSQASLISSIMTTEPQPILQLQPMTPPTLDRLVRACLAKDPDDRIQTAHDILLQLQWITEGEARHESSAQRAAPRSRSDIWIAASLLLLATCAALSWQLLARNETKPARVWSTIPGPQNARLMASGDTAGPVAVSPDGRSLAFVASSAEGVRLWIRSLDSPVARPLTGTEGALFPFWSPDSHMVGYFAREKLYSVPAEGGPSVSICSAPAPRGGSWGPDGTIIFAPQYRSEICRVSAAGGNPAPLTELDESRHTSHRWPAFCPDGRHFLYFAIAHGATQSEHNAVYLASLDGGQPRQVMQCGSNAVMVGERLLYMRDSTLVAAHFDITAAKLVDEPRVIASDVMCDFGIWRGAFSACTTGTLAFHTGMAGRELQLKRVDRTGKLLGNIGEPWNFGGISLSPDGKYVAADVQESQTDIWVYDVVRGGKSKLTFGNRVGANVEPHWSSDGQNLYYGRVDFGRRGIDSMICRRPAMGGDEEVLFTCTDDCWVMDCSNDGKYLLLGRGRYVGGNPYDIWVLSLTGEHKAFPLLDTPFQETHSQFSPDGKWVAYQSDDSGRSEIYVIPFRPPAENGVATSQPIRVPRRQVSTDCGAYPSWRGDGKEIYYVSNSGKLMAATFEVSAGNVDIGVPTELFTIDQVAGIDPYDVSTDGQWFVINSSTAQQYTSIELITNWDADLSKP